jgi:MFS family permease
MTVRWENEIPIIGFGGRRCCSGQFLLGLRYSFFARTIRRSSCMPPPSLALPTSDAKSARKTFPPVRFAHYGIVILAFAALSNFMSGPGQTHSMGTFAGPMATDLGLSQTTYSTAYMIATALAALNYSLLGRIIDRHGARSLMAIGAAALGAACCLMSAVPQDFIIVLYAGMFFCRLLGQGLLSLVATWLVGEWFEKRRGLAMGIAGLGGSLSVMVTPGFSHTMIGLYGWRETWLMLAAILWISTVIPSLLFVRNRPEDVGLLPDLGRPGNDPDEVSVVAPVVANSEISQLNWTVAEALRTATFWKLLAGVASWGMIGTGLVFYQAEVLAPAGVPTHYAYWLLAIQAATAILSSLIAGYFTGIIPARYLICLSVCGLAAAVSLLLTMTNPWMAIPYAVMIGINGGILRSTGMVVWVNFYGRKNQGAIAGTAMSISAIASACGPLPLALASDHFGSHQPALVIFLVIAVLAACAVFTARPPQKDAA